jgi:hypothetical protein
VLNSELCLAVQSGQGYTVRGPNIRKDICEIVLSISGVGSGNTASDAAAPRQNKYFNWKKKILFSSLKFLDY